MHQGLLAHPLLILLLLLPRHAGCIPVSGVLGADTALQMEQPT
jgi:hypothetical protein